MTSHMHSLSFGLARVAGVHPAAAFWEAISRHSRLDRLREPLHGQPTPAPAPQPPAQGNVPAAVPSPPVGVNPVPAPQPSVPAGPNLEAERAAVAQVLGQYVAAYNRMDEDRLRQIDPSFKGIPSRLLLRQVTLTPSEVVISGLVTPNTSTASIRRVSSTPLTMLPHWSDPPSCTRQPTRRSSSRKS